MKQAPKLDSQAEEVAAFFEHLVEVAAREVMDPAAWFDVDLLARALQRFPTVWEPLHARACEFLDENNLRWVQEEIDQAQEEAKRIAKEVVWK